METAEQLERRYARTKRLVPYSIAAAGAFVALHVLVRLGLGLWIFGVDEDGRRNFDDPVTVYGVLFLGSQIGFSTFLAVIAGLRWKLWRLGDAIARAHTLERMTDAQKDERVHVLGE